MIIKVKLKTFLYTLTGGRPMKRMCYAYTECTSEREFFRWMDGLGQQWIAGNSWSLIRKRVDPE